MIQVALQMLFADKAKYAGLTFGIAFTSFLVTFAASYFTGFMTQGFSLITESRADVWVMAPVATSVEETGTIPGSSLQRVRGVPGVESALPMLLGTVEATFPNGRFQSFQLIGVDDASLFGLPEIEGGVPAATLRAADAAVVDAGGTSGKLGTPIHAADLWPHDYPRLQVPTRELQAGDELVVNDRRVLVVGRSHALPRYPPRPLLYTTLGNAARLLPPERHTLSFVLVCAASGYEPRRLAQDIERATGLRARSSADFKADTVRWILVNSEDVGDIAAMLALAMTIGLGVTGVMLYMFTQENMRYYAVLSALGATPRILLRMVFAQAGACALIGAGLGLGLCGLVGEAVAASGYPFRMMWFNPLLAALMVFMVSIVAAALSIRPVLKLEPAQVFAGR